MCDSISRVEDTAGGATGGVEREHSLDVDIHGRDVEGLEHDLSHPLAVGLRVHRCLGQQHWMLLWVHSMEEVSQGRWSVTFSLSPELVVECVVPDLLHVIPVGDDSMLDWILECEDASL